LSVEVVRKPPKLVPEEMAKVWAREWANDQGHHRARDHPRTQAQQEGWHIRGLQQDEGCVDGQSGEQHRAEQER